MGDTGAGSIETLRGRSGRIFSRGGSDEAPTDASSLLGLAEESLDLGGGPTDLASLLPRRRELLLLLRIDEAGGPTD